MKERFRWEKLDRSCDLCPSHLSWGHRGQCLHRHWDTQPKLPAGHLPTTEKGFVKISNINAHTDIGTDIDNIRRREREEESAAYASHPSCLFSTCVSTQYRHIAHPFSSLQQTPCHSPQQWRVYAKSRVLRREDKEEEGGGYYSLLKTAKV